MTNKYIELFESLEETLESLLPIGKLRKKAIKDFKSLGFPNSKMENWRNFNLKDFSDKEYQMDIEQKELDLGFFEFIPEIENEGLFIMYNGFSSFDMQIEKYKNGVIFGSLRAAINKYPELVKKYLNKANKQTLNGFNALNTAFCADGFFLFVPEGIEVKMPYTVVNYFQNNKYDMVSIRNIVAVEDNSSINLVNIEASGKKDMQFVNNITEVFLGKNSKFEWDRLQKYNGKTIAINPVFIDQQETSRLNKTISTLRGFKLRNDIHNKMSGEHSNSEICGIYILDDGDQVENRVYLDHAVPNCDSNQLFKGVLDGKSKGAFTGYVLVRQDSQKTNAFQSNKNIVISEDARIKTNPFLEIYADDVKCSHGASVGSLDENALFYLRSRGIDMKKARNILLSAFALDALGNMENKGFKELVSSEIESSLVKD
jgi:Fe-S cluster assembly protein SufD